ncbi:MAG TPA: TVP38/TMEM64 family protein, partial [Pseudomonadaceae bacterium]|nr:TVP38/TMEM64 family protein [Pseudomonadaceae bacterium]
GFFQRMLQRNPTFAVIAESVAHDGWKTVMLTRTIPLFPFKLSNYCFGVIPVSLREFAAGTLLGVIPLTVTNVSIGALAADIGGLLEGRQSLGSAQFALIALGIVSGIVTFLLVRKRAKEKFAALEQKQSEQQENSGAMAPPCEGSHG